MTFSGRSWLARRRPGRPVLAIRWVSGGDGSGGGPSGCEMRAAAARGTPSGALSGSPSGPRGVRTCLRHELWGPFACLSLTYSLLVRLFRCFALLDACVRPHVCDVLARTSPSSTNFGLISACLRPTLASFGQLWTCFGQIQAMIGQIRLRTAILLPSSAKFGLCSAEFGRSRPTLSRFRPTWSDFGRCSTLFGLISTHVGLV